MISVALAAYNGEKYIEQQLESLRVQTLPPDEVVICDDGSSDRTVALCRAFIARHALDGWRVEENGGNLGYCRNFYGAIEKTSGDIVFLCDQDDVWDADKLAVMTRVLKEHPQVRLLAARYRLIDADGKPAQGVSVPHYAEKFDGSLKPVTADSLIGHSYIRGCSMCFRRELKPLLRPLELRSLLGHDWQLAMLAALTGGALMLNTPLMSYRCHGENASFSSDPTKRERRLEKRLAGLRESVEGHEALLPLVSDRRLARRIQTFIRFERRRIAFLQTRSLPRFLALFFFLRQYRRYYAGGGVRVWLGDFVYAYKKSFKPQAG